MNRLFWGIALLVVTVAGGWAQSTWRGQAEVWSAADAPTEGFVAASNEFPRNSLLTIENYKTRKTIQVRVVAGLPAGSTALVLLNARAAQALEIKAGEIPLVGVKLDPTGIDRADNPDPDVNPLAAKPGAAVAAAPVPAADPPTAVTPSTPVATVTESPAPTLAPEAKDTTARTPAVTSLEVARGSTALDPDLLPLPALADPEPVAEPADRVPLPVAEEPEEAAPVTPGRKVFVTTREPEPVASEVVEETPPAVEVPVETVEGPPVEEAPVVAEVVPEAEPEVVPEPVEETPVLVEAEPSAEPEEAPAVAEVPAEVPAPEPVKAPSPVALVPLPAVPAAAWVAVPGKLEGPVLGAVPVLAGLEKGRSYVQLGAWASEADVLAALGAVKSYVPLALYKAEGEKNPWRVVVAAAPKAQLGILLMHYRSQGFRTAGLVKG